MRDHLKRKHPEKWYSNANEINDEADADPGGSAKKRSRSNIKDYVRQDYYSGESARKKWLDKLYVKMIVQDLEPFRKGEHGGFKTYSEGLDPKYQIVSTTSLKTKLIPAYFNEVKEKLQNALNSAKYIAITSDMWSSIANEGILSITGHFIHEGELIAPLIKVVKVDGHHTADRIATVIDEVLLEFNIISKIVAMVTDNLQAMVNVAEQLKVRHIPCFAHTLNLAVQDSFKVEEFQTLINKCKKIVTFFRSSTLASDTLRAIQNQNNKTQLKLIQENNTRWNSVFYMLERICMIKTELLVAMSECPKAPPSLDAIEYEIIKEIIEILKPFEVATELISGEKYVTLSLIIPLIRGTQAKLANLETSVTSEIGLKIVHSLKDSISRRFQSYERRSPTLIATLLNPKYKKLGFKTREDAERAVQLLQNEYTNYLSSQPNRPNFNEPQSQSATLTSNTRNSKEEDFLSFLKIPQVATPLSESIIDIRQYLEKPVIEMSECPLNYWKTSCTNLKEIAWKYLCIPGSSVPSERIFSKAGQTLTEKRNRLKSKRLNEILFLNQNIPIFDK